MLKVFVSSTYKDLVEERSAVLKLLNALNTQSVAMEVFGPKPETPLETSMRELDSSKVYLGIIGLEYGSCPPGQTKSFTQLEYQHAQRKGKPSLIVLKEGEVKDEHQAGFRSLLKEQTTTARFRDIPELLTHIVRGVLDQAGLEWKEPPTGKRVMLSGNKVKIGGSIVGRDINIMINIPPPSRVKIPFYDLMKSVLEQLVTFLSSRSERRSEVFNNHVEPLFTKMLQIQVDYRRMFTDLQNALLREPMTKKEVLAHVNGRRNEMVDMRWLCYAIADSLSAQWNEIMVTGLVEDRKLANRMFLFARSIVQYFSLSRECWPPTSASSTLLRRLEDELQGTDSDALVPLDIVTKTVTEILKLLDGCWNDLCSSYASFRTYCL